MAGSRLSNFGTIFSRATGLLQSGAIKEAPIWYEVYKAYPPVLEPEAERPSPPQEPIPEILYEEDFERAALSQNKYKTRNSKGGRSVRLASLDFVKDVTS